MPQTISIPCPEGGAFDAYLTSPAGAGSIPAIVVVSSIFGVTDGLKTTMDRFATRGFHLIAADPFWRTHPGPLEHSQMDQGRKRSGQWTVEQGFSDVRATLAQLAALPNWNGKFAILGYCFGGIHAMLGLTRLGADAAVAFHGVRMTQYLEGCERVTKPYSFHYAEVDPVVSLEDVERVRTALAGKPGEIHVYAAKHGFSQIEAPAYDPAVATLAEERAFAILDQLK